MATSPKSRFLAPPSVSPVHRKFDQRHRAIVLLATVISFMGLPALICLILATFAALGWSVTEPRKAPALEPVEQRDGGVVVRGVR